MFVRRAALLVALFIATCVALAGPWSATAPPAGFSNAPLQEPREQRAVDLLSATIGDRVTTIVHAVALDWDHDGDMDVVAASRGADLVLWINDGTDHLEPRRVSARDRLTSRPVVLDSEPTDDSPAMPSGHRQHYLVFVVSCRWLPVAAAPATSRESVAAISPSSVASPSGRAPPLALS